MRALQTGNRLFMAAVAPLIEKKAEDKAVQMLPAFVCHRPADRELVRDLVDPRFITR